MTENANKEGQESGLQLPHKSNEGAKSGAQSTGAEKKSGRSHRFRRPSGGQPKGDGQGNLNKGKDTALSNQKDVQGKGDGRHQNNPLNKGGNMTVPSQKGAKAKKDSDMPVQPVQNGNKTVPSSKGVQTKEDNGRQNKTAAASQESKKILSGENKSSKSRHTQKTGNANQAKAADGKQNNPVKAGDLSTASQKSTQKKTENGHQSSRKNNSGRGKKKLDVAQVMSNLQYPQFDSVPENAKEKKRGGGKLSIIPLGGLGEIGKNMTAIRYGDTIIVIDGGMAFPDDDLLGIDLVIPDYSYLLENRDLVKAIVLTHGHEDHIGAVPYILKDMKVPIYGGKLTLGLLAQKFKEHHLSDISMNVVEPRNIIPIGPLKMEFIRVAHSIPDAMAVAIHTPIGVVLHTGDFKMDMSPVAGEPMDYRRLAALGDKGVLVMLSDSTNVEREGYTASEKTIGQSLENIFRSANGRIILTTFASNVHRVQQAIWAAESCGRKVTVVGRGMCNVVGIATEMGYLTFEKGTMIEVEDLNKYPPDQVLIITTGSQGEQLAGLTRMSLDEHRQVRLLPGDMVVISANPIPGNELLVSRTIDNLYRHGAQVIYGSSWGVHVSGHASSEELKLMLNLARPRFFIPAHGEYRMLHRHAMLAQNLGMNKDNIFIMENGQVLEVSRYKAKLSGKVQSGRVLVDGFGVGDVGASVLKDRKQLANEGIVIVALVVDEASGTITVGPEILTKGFVFEKENDHLLDEAKGKVQEVFQNVCKDYCDAAALKSGIRSTLGRFFYDHIGRKPIVLPMVMIS